MTVTGLPSLFDLGYGVGSDRYIEPSVILGADYFAEYGPEGRFQDLAATTPAVALNDPVRRWDDIGPNDLDLIFGDAGVYGAATHPMLLGPTLNGVPCVGSGLVANNGLGTVRQMVTESSPFGADTVTIIGVIQSGDESYTALFEVLETAAWHFRSFFNTDIDTDPNEAQIIQQAAFIDAGKTDLRIIGLDGPFGDSLWNQQAGPDNFTKPPIVVAWPATFVRAECAMWSGNVKFPVADLPVASAGPAADTGDSSITPHAAHLPSLFRIKDLSRYWHIVMASGLPTDAKTRAVGRSLSIRYRLALDGLP